MLLEEFDFDLPEHLIAQVPLQKRDASRLLVLNKNNKEKILNEEVKGEVVLTDLEEKIKT